MVPRDAVVTIECTNCSKHKIVTTYEEFLRTAPRHYQFIDTIALQCPHCLAMANVTVTGE